MSGDLLSSFDPFTADDGSNGFVGHGEAIWESMCLETTKQTLKYISLNGQKTIL